VPKHFGNPEDTKSSFRANCLSSPRSIIWPYIKLALKSFMKSENIVLFGMTRVGKITVSRSLSEALGFDFIDLVNDWR